jgi:hypothetical protein
VANGGFGIKSKINHKVEKIYKDKITSRFQSRGKNTNLREREEEEEEKERTKTQRPFVP